MVAVDRVRHELLRLGVRAAGAGEAVEASVRPVIDVYATQPNYWRHLAPIVDALRSRGHDVRSWTGAKRRPWGQPLKGRHERGVVTLCAAWTDATALAPHPTVYVEHGAGQTYLGESRGYAGGRGLDHVVLFIGPGQHVADRWRASYPQAAVESVGCPALDRHLPVARRSYGAWCQGGASANDGRADNGLRPRGALVVAVTSHWRCLRLNETMPALKNFMRGIATLSRLEDIQLLGHAHPRQHLGGAERWKQLGIEFDPDPDSVLARADLLVADNTSLMYEAAAVDVPVLALNSPLYRREVEHGLRFWSHVPGLQCDDPADLEHAVLTALGDPYPAQLLRQRAAWHVYAHRDGTSAARAADAIERVL